MNDKSYTVPIDRFPRGTVIRQIHNDESLEYGFEAVSPDGTVKRYVVSATNGLVIEETTPNITMEVGKDPAK